MEIPAATYAKAAALDQKLAETLNAIRELEQTRIDADDRDKDALAGWFAGAEKGARPEATAPRIAEQLAHRLGRDVTAVDALPDGPVPPRSAYAEHCRRLMFDHYRAHGFTGSPRVLEALLGRPPRTFAQHLAGLDLPAAVGELA